MFDISEIKSFLTVGIWQIRQKNLTGFKAVYIKLLRIILVTIREYKKDQCQLRASALTFYTVFSIVPVFALLFGIAKGFNIDNRLEKHLIANLEGQETALRSIIDFARNLLDNTKGGLVAGIGVLIIFWTVIKVMGTIEQSFNDIWAQPKSRTFLKKISDFISLLVLMPILFLMSVSITIFIQQHDMDLWMGFGFIVPILLKLLPIAILCGAFTFIYVFLPNKNIPIKSGIFGGIFGGIAFYFTQLGLVVFQIGVTKYNSIYGTFSALPLFFAFVQFSWLIVLLGAEVSYAHHIVDDLEFENECERLTFKEKNLFSLYVLHHIVCKFHKKEEAPDAIQITDELDIPTCCTSQILMHLQNAKLINSITSEEDQTVRFQPAFDIHDMNIHRVTMLLEEMDGPHLEHPANPVFENLKKNCESIRQAGADHDANILLMEIEKSS